MRQRSGMADHTKAWAGSRSESEAMGFVNWRLVGILRSRGRHRAEDFQRHYEPWAVFSMELFEREIEAFYRRSQFTIVISARRDYAARLV